MAALQGLQRQATGAEEPAVVQGVKEAARAEAPARLCGEDASRAVLGASLEPGPVLELQLAQPAPEPSPLGVACSPSPQLPRTLRPLSPAHPGEDADVEERGGMSGAAPAARSPELLPSCLLSANFCSIRCRKSCYFDATVRWGVQGFTPYNHMLLPVGFSGVVEEYESLKNAVCLWDVACERQVELLGKDALRLAEMLTPRPLASMNVGECRYAMITDEAGKVLNDPVVLKLEEERYWLSIADSDLLLWIKGLALGMGLDVRVTEPGVSPLAVQGPYSLPLVRDLFGDWAAELKFYHFRHTELDGIPLLLARSGWSPERGYELYLQDESRGDELWERVMRAGQKYAIKPGTPNQIRRIEGGLLSYGADVTREHNALELGLPTKWCSGDKAPDFLGKAALQRPQEGGPRRLIVGLELPAAGSADNGPGALWRPWKVTGAGGEVLGHVTSICYSPTVGMHLAIATLAWEATKPGTTVTVQTPGCGHQRAVVRKLPFMRRKA